MSMAIGEWRWLDIDDLHDQLEQAIVNLDADGPTHFHAVR